MAIPPEAIERFRDSMKFFRRLGWNPVPSRPDYKAPLVPYAHLWAEVGPDDWLDYRTGNIQIMTGAHWGLIGVDLDGAEAVGVWREWAARYGCPPTWVVHSPSGGRHLWFSVPTAAPVPSRWVWSGGDDAREVDPGDGRGPRPWVVPSTIHPAFRPKHSAIEIIGEKKLLMCPPSVHPDLGEPYRFADGYGPRFQTRPAPAPWWLLALPEVRPFARSNPSPGVRSAALAVVTAPAVRGSDHASYSRNDVLDAIPSIPSLVAEWGVEVVSVPRGSDFAKVRSIDRPGERNPSATINVETGRYKDFASGRDLTLFDLAVALRAYPDWITAKISLGERFGAAVTSRAV